MKKCKVEGCENEHYVRNYCNKHYIRKRRDGTLSLLPKIIRKCIVDGCEKKYLAGGYCSIHYQRLLINGTLEKKLWKKHTVACSVDGCEKMYYSLGYCDLHYQRFKKYGKTEKRKKQKIKKICLVGGCDNTNIMGYGYCVKHYRRFKKYGNTKKRVVEKKYCIVDGCDNEYNSNGYCSKHYTRLSRNGSLEVLKCSNGELAIKNWLKKNDYDFEVEKRFNGCRNKHTLPFDFCVNLGKSIVLIEYDGKQHYEPIEFFGGDEYFEKIKFRDSIKNKFCKDNDIELIRIKYTENNVGELLEGKLNDQIKENNKREMGIS